jgi:radical SAM protein with 4Fe4S-binding SPASM domain
MRIDLSKLNPQQKGNLESALEAYRNKYAISSPSPSAIFIELTQNCIAKCAFCHGPNWKNSPSYNMPNDIFEIILREYVPYASLVDLRGRGESLMLSELPDYIRRIASYGPRIRLITTLGCGTKETLQALVDYDVFVSVSFDAADKDLYENTRCGIKYDTVIGNLEYLSGAMLDKYGSIENHMRIDICPLQKKNLKYVKGIMKLTHRLKIKDILIGPLSDSPLCPDHLYNNKFMTVAAFKQFSKYSTKFSLHYLLTKPPFEAMRIKEMTFDRCCHPWLYALITYNGSLIFCDHLLGIKEGDPALLGNVKSPKDEIWNGHTAQSLRIAHINKTRSLISQCKACYQEGRYAEFEQILCPEFAKYNFTEKELRLLTRRFSAMKYIFLITDISFIFKNNAKLLLRKKFPKIYAFLKSVKKFWPTDDRRKQPS